MLKKKIVIASVLKPLNDARMYEKFGISLAKNPNYEVHIIGYPSPIPHNENIIFHPTFKFERISVSRIRSYWNIAKIVAKLNPEVLIVNTSELLTFGLLHKTLFGSKLLYDVQENYFRNIWYQANFPPLIKPILALLVRGHEMLVSPFLDHKLLSEEKYKEELPFVRTKSTVILNKYNPIHFKAPEQRSRDNVKIRLLYTGTVSKSYGVLEAIKFYKAIQHHSPATLKIIGHCIDNQLFIHLKKEEEKDQNLILKISLDPIPHQEIEESYRDTDYALTPYPKNKSTENCIPAKFYEYIAYKIPIIIPDDNNYWKDFLSSYRACYAVNFNSLDVKTVLKGIKENSFYDVKGTADIYWETEEIKLLKVIGSL